MTGLSNKRKQQLKSSFRDNIGDFLYGRDPYNFLKYNIMRDLDTTRLSGHEQCYIWSLFMQTVTPDIDKMNKIVQTYVKKRNFVLDLDSDDAIGHIFTDWNIYFEPLGHRLSLKHILVGYSLETMLLNIAEYVAEARRIDNRFTLKKYQQQAGRVVLDETLQTDIANDDQIIESYETFKSGKWRLRELKNTCEFYGLPIEGTKEVLEDRLSKHFSKRKPTNTTAPARQEKRYSEKKTPEHQEPKVVKKVVAKKTVNRQNSKRNAKTSRGRTASDSKRNAKTSRGSKRG